MYAFFWYVTGACLQKGKVFWVCNASAYLILLYSLDSLFSWSQSQMHSSSARTFQQFLPYAKVTYSFNSYVAVCFLCPSYVHNVTVICCHPKSVPINVIILPQSALLSVTDSLALATTNMCCLHTGSAESFCLHWFVIGSLLNQYIYIASAQHQLEKYKNRKIRGNTCPYQRKCMKPKWCSHVQLLQVCTFTVQFQV